MEFVKIPLFCQAVGAVIHFLLCYYFVVNKGKGIQGIGYASTLSNLIVFTCMIAYSRT